ncbi:MAG TPA: adenylate/guanylate cyclase domain-containing protein [Gaiellaceae bacterium]|nr:adenylate/guanylate cyclase domain-containing protein [Gaiellaceae bacterium]
MPDCPSCGHENAADARFCSACGTALATADPAREQRKVVTVLFCDLVGSTALGESTDPEALRARMRRYFEDLRVILERHGGSVEKFVGDAVMAVFGIPVSHEDDALRAVRAAAEMRAAIAEHGLEARIGINTGEVVVGGEGETLVTGDAVNVAARLEQAAPNGEILIGAATRLLVRDAVHVAAVEPLALKGKSEPVEAFRLLQVISDAAALARHLDTPLVGRERERQRLWRDYEDAVADRTCRLFTLLGPAGIGKSRLVADFLDRIGDSADILRGRCLSYGEGITYWPLVEILISIGVEPESIIGTSPPETQLAFRRLLEARADGRPQVVVIDDLQWAEPVFVDLVEHVADLSRDAPIFLLCIARTELLDSRPDWGGGKLNATSLLLEPLGAGDCAELIERLGTDALDAGLRERITVASAGNPLYVEEMLAMVREHGGEGEILVPPTIHALLQARIDSLDGDVRVVMERGSVEGEVFHRGSVAVLSPDPVRTEVESHLATLVRKELIRSTSPIYPEDEGFRFRHLLIRDAAYESLPKATRAELHESFARWLATHDLVEIDEIVGYHLEQAHRYRSELDPADPELSELGRRAARHLAPAGQAAMDRGDWGAARGLLRRARNLVPEGSDERASLGPDLALTLQEVGENAEAVAVAEEAARAEDPVIRARGVIAIADALGFGAGEFEHELMARAEEARATLEMAGDELGLAQYWRLRGYSYWARLQAAKAREAWERALAHAVAAGAHRLQVELQNYILSAVHLGPTPVAEALPIARAALERATPSSLAEASALRAVGMLRGCEGFVDEARELHERGRETFHEAGLQVTAAGWAMAQSEIEWRAGDLEAQERVLREAVEILDRLQDQFFYSTVSLRLADCLLLRRRADDPEVAAITAAARERTLPGDLVNFLYLDSIEARRLAHEGSADEAVDLARRAAENAETTDNFDVRSHVWSALAETLHVVGEASEAGRAADRAVAIRTAKGDVAGAAVLERWLRERGVSSG